MTDDWDDGKASEFIGKRVLVGITYLDAAEKVIEQKQFHGFVVRANRKEGVVLSLASNGKELKLPPSTRVLELAAPGEYRLRSTGEIVVDPDYTCTWSVKKPTAH